MGIDSDIPFDSRRSVVLGTHGAVACGQPHATTAGIEILKAGGNAADAAVAVAACMNVCQPCSTGLGGDAFCLFYDAKEKKVKAVNGSGRSPAALSLEVLQQDKSLDLSNGTIPLRHGHAVTVPGAAACWMDTVAKHGSGKLSMGEILKPATFIAEGGFPVSEITAESWNKGSFLLKDKKNIHGKSLLINGEAPRHGQVFKNPDLAKCFKTIASEGKRGFYCGQIGKAIVEAVKSHGGVMEMSDLEAHQTTFEDPISVDYKGVTLWEIPPNGQGIVALMALNLLKEFDVGNMGHNTAEYLHTLIESLRISFSDGIAHIADPSKVQVPIQELLSDKYAQIRRKLITDRANEKIPITEDLTVFSSDTIYLTVVDGEGNACSFINSNYMGFGTGIVPEGCGFALQNRGCNFSLEPNHLNCVAPNKRPYHTIIPAMLTNTKTGELLCSYGVMGGFMQPQGHVQVLLNMLEFGMDPQKALNQPRFCIGPGHLGPVGAVSLEEGITEDAVSELRKRGHKVDHPVTGYNRALFGRGHVITKGSWWAKYSDFSDDNVLWSGTDPRADGSASAF